MRKLFFIAFFAVHVTAICQPTNVQRLLDSLRLAGNFPGLSFAIVNKDNQAIAFAAGYNNREKKIPLQTSDKMMQGSVGKTYVAAIALRLVLAKELDLDKKVSEYLGHYHWFKNLPNSKDIRVRMLMNHTSGIMRYEFKKQFTDDLTAQPAKVWKPAELVSYVLHETPAFTAGNGWDYSDTNYILLGLIIEQITGRPYYALLNRLLDSLHLSDTHPSDKRLLPGLAHGYAGEGNDFGNRDKVLNDSGLFIINPQFEWTGGGVYATASDLAKWGKYLFEGRIVDTAVMLSDAVPAKLGRDTKYGLGVIVRNTPLGVAYGHSGFFPGYMTELLYFPTLGVSAALQCNSSDFKQLRLSLLRCLLELVKESSGQR